MEPKPPGTNAVLHCLSNDRRRFVLVCLQGKAYPVPVDDVAARVAAWETGASLARVTGADCQRVGLALRTTALPRLDELGLVAWDDDTDTVAVGDHPALSDPSMAEVLRPPAVVRTELAPVLRNLADDRRRAVLSVLRDHGDWLSVRELAATLATRAHDGEPDDDRVDAVHASLHHRHVPHLRETGLVRHRDGAVAYRDHPAVPVRWLEDPPPGTGGSAATDEGLRTLEGRADVIDRGQSLFEYADEELFLMVTTDGLLEPDCVTGLQDAVDRGVEVYFGSQTPAVRDLVREELPEATIWEPQLDWLNLPPRRERVGRLVLADRAAIMLGTLGEPDADGVPAETAITAEGEDNPLVAMMRELLGSRLDHLDAQSETFLEELPL